MQYTVRGSSLFLSSEERKAAAKRRSRTECDIKLGTILYLATRAAASTNDTHTCVSDQGTGWLLFIISSVATYVHRAGPISRG